MAKVTFTFEDTPNGVLIRSDPGLEQLLALANNDDATSAHGYAMTAWLAIGRENKAAKQRPSGKTH
ncbi:MAG: hypothetical protein K9L79_01445 [Methylobacter tundripaludum]|nr:hypothetical protein [Methylobacter tundripaludum]